MLNKALIYLSCLLAAALAAPAQNMLTLEDAIKQGLERNNGVLVYKNLEQVARYQNNFGNAGMSPSVAVVAGYNYATLNSHQEFNTGVVQDRTGAASQNLNASLVGYWTIFDGLRMFAVKRRLELNEGLSAITLKQQMETTVYSIITAYYNIVRLKELIKAAQQNLLIGQERKKIASVRLEIGSDSRYELLMAQIDENRAQSAIAQLELQLLGAKSNLSVLLNSRADQDFNTADTILVNYEPTLEELKKTSVTNNTSILFSKQNELIAEQNIREVRANNLPLIQLNGAYTITRNQSQAGIIFLNRQVGPNFGITANWLLFNGNRNRRLVQERDLLALNQRLQTNEAMLQVDAAVYISYQSFLMNKKIASLELMSVRDLMDLQFITLERYRLGRISLLETIQAQKNFEDAKVSYINALYAMKIAEADLMRANGTLVR